MIDLVALFAEVEAERRAAEKAADVREAREIARIRAEIREYSAMVKKSFRQRLTRPS